jgi:hypothetical protein
MNNLNKFFKKYFSLFKSDNVLELRSVHISTCLKLQDFQIEKLKRVADIVKTSFCPQDWIENVPRTELPYYVHLFHADCRIKKIKSEIISENLDLIDYLNSNIYNLKSKEKAIAFKLFSLLSHDNHVNQSLSLLLFGLEANFYSESIERCDLVDFINYADGFLLFRPTNLHFGAASTDLIYRKVLAVAKKATQSDESCLENNAVSDNINSEWSLNRHSELINSVTLLNKLDLLNKEALSKFLSSFICFHYDDFSQANINEHVLLSLGKIHHNLWF